MSIAQRNLQLQQRHPLQSSWVSFAIFRSAKEVSAMDRTCVELMGSGSDAIAASIASFIMATVSGENDAFEKSFITSGSFAVINY